MSEFWFSSILLSFAFGMALGVWLCNRKWREKGDHPYMNRMASGGHLYQVKREND